MHLTFSYALLFLFLSSFNAIAGASISLLSYPSLVYRSKTYLIGWGGGDGTTVNVTLHIGGPSTSLSLVGTLWTGAATSMYWTVDPSLKVSNYYVIKVAQSGNADYSNYFDLALSLSSSVSTKTSSLSISSSSSSTSRTSSIQPSQTTTPTSNQPIDSSPSTEVTSSQTAESSPSTQVTSTQSTHTKSPIQITSVPTTVTQISTITPAPCTSQNFGDDNNTSCEYSYSTPRHTSHTALVGMIVGIIIAVIAVLGGIFLFLRRSFKRKYQRRPPVEPPPQSQIPLPYSLKEETHELEDVQRPDTAHSTVHEVQGSRVSKDSDDRCSELDGRSPVLPRDYCEKEVYVHPSLPYKIRGGEPVYELG